MIRPRFASRKIFCFALLVLGGLAFALLSGCKYLNLHGRQSTFEPAGPVAKRQLDLFMTTVYVTSFVFAVVGSILAYAMIRFRARGQDTKAKMPHQSHGNPLIEIGLIVASFTLLAIIAVPTLRCIWFQHDVPEEEKANAMDVTATGYQWWFKFDYDKETVNLPDGKNGPVLSTGNELVIPASVPIRVHLRTADVIHSFWIPKLAGKVDMIPNRPNFLWFKTEKPGYYYGQCAEYCGDSHATMRFRVIALSPSKYIKWLDNQKKPARAMATTESSKIHIKSASFKPRSSDTGPGSTLSGSKTFDADPFAAWKEKQTVTAGENPDLIAQGRKLFSEKTCISCHTVRGHEGIGVTGPELTHVGSRSTIAAGVLENTPERMHQWIKDPSYFKPGNKMYFGGYYVQQGKEWKQNFHLDDKEIDAMVAYLQSLK